VVGVEYDAGLVDLAARYFPWVPVVRADARHLPVQDGTVDAIVMLDVLEHLADPAAVLATARRALHPGGCLIVSVPHQGLLAGLDANNVYTRLRRRRPSWPDLEATDRSATGVHRHFTVAEVGALLGDQFQIDRVARTGLGVAEIIHLAILLLFRVWLPWRGVYRALRQLHFIAYLLEDFVPAGRLAYHLTVRARAV
jgi:SAM-dependent methyltransferase